MAKWNIDTDHAFAEFSAKHIGISWVHGSMHGITGFINYDEAHPENTTFEGEVDATTLNTGVAMRDGHLKGPDFLDVEKFPKFTFKSTAVHMHDDHAHVAGELTMKGITKQIELEGSINGVTEKQLSDGNIVEVVAFSLGTVIDRRDYDMNWNVNMPGGNLLVGNEINIMIDVEAIKE